jgi:hypothetical protein
MFGRPKSVAPEPYFTASLELLYHVAIYVRMLTARPENVTEAHLREINSIMDAIHNIPTSIVRYGEWFTEDQITEALERLDHIYEGRTEFRWSSEFQKFLRAAREHDAKQA